MFYLQLRITDTAHRYMGVAEGRRVSGHPNQGRFCQGWGRRAGVQCAHTVTQIRLDNFSNIVDSNMQRYLRSCSKKLHSVFGLTMDTVEQYIPCMWSPHSVGLVSLYKRRFRPTKRFTRCSNLAYRERLPNLGLDRLELRRLRFDLIYMCKIFFWMIETDASVFFRVCDTIVLPHADIAYS